MRSSISGSSSLIGAGSGGSSKVLPDGGCFLTRVFTGFGAGAGAGSGSGSGSDFLFNSAFGAFFAHRVGPL